MNIRTKLMTPVLLVAIAGACGDSASSEGSGDSASSTVATSQTGADSTMGGGFDIADDDPSAYSRVDRMGLAGVNTALITSKDAYNQADPAGDADFVPEITAAVTALHDALDDDLVAAGLVPCAPKACLGVAGPIAVPDTLKIDPSMPSGFPNGRRLEDPVMDIILAVLLLDMEADGQDPGTLAGLPLNPAANDLPFPGTFPYLAQPHG